MKKLSKFIAVTAAAALFLAMGVSAFAAGSPAADQMAPAAGTVDGQEIPLVAVPLEQEPSETEVKDLLDEAGFDVSGVQEEQIVIIGSEDISAADGSRIEGEITVELNVPDGTAPGDIIYVLHEVGDGVWEVFEVVVTDDGIVTVTLNGLSPVLMVKVMSDGSTVALNQKVDDPVVEDDPVVDDPVVDDPGQDDGYDVEEDPDQEDVTDEGIDAEEDTVSTEKKSPKTGI